LISRPRPMPWSDWLSADLAPEQLLTLELQRRYAGGLTLDQARALAIDLAELATRQEAALAAAVARIAALERELEREHEKAPD
jgi:hypothetical protein